MAIDVVRTRERTETKPKSRRVLDVSGVPAARVAEYAREAAAGGAGDDVYLERKGGRTFLVAN